MKSLFGILKYKKINKETLEEIEELLIRSDVDLETSRNLIDELSTKNFSNLMENSALNALSDLIKETLVKRQGTLDIESSSSPKILLVVGVNGTGKTTTIAKLANYYKNKDKKIMLVAADTFRAAATEQLKMWSQKLNVNIYLSNIGDDPASVVYKGYEEGMKQNTDILIIDTAGRLQNKINLMLQLEKITKVIKKISVNVPHKTLMILDATTGQNGLKQIEEFNKHSSLDGIIMTKLDSTAKGGILISLSKRHEIPILAIGNGEKIDDFEEFNPLTFAHRFVGL